METRKEVEKIKLKEKDVLGHRKRVKENFLKTKFNSWHDYEILELALFFVIPRKDTKSIAKELIKKFGSLKEVLTADYEEMNEFFKHIDGVGKNTAFFFYFLKNISIKYSEFKIKEKKQLSSPSDVVEFLKNYIGTLSEEKMVAIFLNASNKVICYDDISDGTVARSAVYPSKIVKKAVPIDARSVIVAHNHPGGICKPSQNDIIATEAVQKALKAVEIVLLDHIIVTSSDFYSFKDNGLI